MLAPGLSRHECRYGFSYKSLSEAELAHPDSARGKPPEPEGEDRLDRIVIPQGAPQVYFAQLFIIMAHMLLELS